LQIAGSDEENYPLTRKVQRDLWIHQHPLNCSSPDVKFLLTDWERLPGFGIGAQIVGMTGLLAIAINEGRVLVTNYYNRAHHEGCKGKLNHVITHCGICFSYNKQPMYNVNFCSPHKSSNTLLYPGSSQSSWSCYFFPETSLECRQRAFELIKSEDAWSKGIVTTKENYTTKHIWAGPTSR